MRPGYFHSDVNKLNLNVAKYVSQTTLNKNMLEIRCHAHIYLVTRYGCLNPTDLVTHVAIGLRVQTLMGSKITESIHIAGGLFCLRICILNDKYQAIDVLHPQNV